MLSVEVGKSASNFLALILSKPHSHSGEKCIIEGLRCELGHELLLEGAMKKVLQFVNAPIFCDKLF